MEAENKTHIFIINGEKHVIKTHATNLLWVADKVMKDAGYSERYGEFQIGDANGDVVVSPYPMIPKPEGPPPYKYIDDVVQPIFITLRAGVGA